MSMLHFRMAAEPLHPDQLRPKIEDPRAGACVVFEGWVRNHNEGRPVLGLDYEAYVELAEKEGARILAEAAERHPLLRVVAEHRTGSLRIGELAVWVGVSAAHRGTAYDASRYIIDEIKARVPIWKREHYADGPTAWVNCHTR